MSPPTSPSTSASLPTHAILRASGACARADLLCALWLAQQHGQDDAAQLAELTGYRTSIKAEDKAPTDTTPKLEDGSSTNPTVQSGAEAIAPAPPPRPKARFWAVTARLAIATNSTTSSNASTPGVDLSRVLQRHELLGQPNAAAPARTDIVPRARLLPALRRSLPATRKSGLDEAQLVASLAAAKALRRLPRRQRKGWAERLLLVLDLSAPLQPYHADMMQLADDLLRWLGRSNVEVRIIDDERQPARRWQAWQAYNGKILLLTELGLTAHDGGAIVHAWGHHLHALQRQGATLEVWCPLPLGKQAQHASLPPLRVVHWSAASRLQAQRLPVAELHRTPARLALAQALRTRLAPLARVEPRLLRAMRLGMQAAASDAGLEHLAWAHPDLSQHATARAILPAHLPEYRQAFAALPSEAKLTVLDTLLQQHLPQRPLLAHIETLAWAAHATAPERASRQSAIDQALAVITRFAHQPWQVANFTRQQLAVFMARFALEADEATRAFCSPAMSRMWVALQKDWLGKREMDETLPGLTVPDLEAALGHGGRAREFWLALDDEQGWLVLQPNQPEPCRCLHPQPVWLSALQICNGQAPARWQLDDYAPLIALARLPWGERLVAAAVYTDYVMAVVAPPEIDGVLQITTASEQITIEEIQRPSWALEWARDSQGLYALAPNPFGEPLRVAYPLGGVASAPVIPAVADSSPRTLWRITPGIKTTGIFVDEFALELDKVGLVASLQINGSVKQAFRYIEPGDFIMGSPDDEFGRYDDEGPQQKVIISAGFWLADTACTQALWQALTGKNPSSFNESAGGSSDHPVEEISWRDVQSVLLRLQMVLATCMVTLPTEAEWEYACRAGHRTPFSFGENISTDQVNFNGDYPYDDAPNGQYRGCTVAVKALSANDWGLYQMHGNVWEWCADTPREYNEAVALDPGLAQTVVISVGGEKPLRDLPVPSIALQQQHDSQPHLAQTAESDKAVRALRGGGWFFNARSARSASRNRSKPDGRGNFTGVRFALRSLLAGKGF